MVERRPDAPEGGGPRVCALAGGVGAARFLRGLVEVVDPAALTVVVNTGDDIERHGLRVCPDVDSVVYGLSGLADEGRGWGVRDESWRCLERLDAYGEETWFQLGDRDLATHVWRSARLREGWTLSAVTSAQCTALGVRARVVPMSDDVVTTRVDCELGDLHLQEWFVRERCRPRVERVRYEGAPAARPAPGVLDAVAAADLVVVCPSNPLISVGPILAVPGVREALRAAPRAVAVTPIVGGAAVKGPLAEMLRWQGVEVSAAGVAAMYDDFCGCMVVDERDAGVVPAVEALGVRAVVADTMMDVPGRAAALARLVLEAMQAAGPPAVAA